MADEKDSNAGAWSRVPTWDGSPQTWRSFRKDMSWWLAGLDIQSTKKYNLAARWLLRQSGVVRQRGEEFDPAELEYQKEVKMPNAETGDDEIVTPEDPLSGINRLLRALEEMTGRTSLDKRGELRNVFYLELKRRSGERISEFATRFRGLIAEMKSEGVTIHDGELGWWFKQKLGLDPLRTQLLDTALAGAEDYSTIECEVLRLFKDLHSADPLHRRQGDGDQRAPLLNRFLSQQANASRPSSYAPSMASSAARSMRSNSSTASSGRLPSNTSYRKPFMQKQAMVSEAEEEIHVDEQANEPPGGDDEMEPQTLEEVLTTEAEVLAAELDEAAAQGVDADTLQEIEESVEAAAEAFLTMKEARSKLQEVRKDRGYGKAPSPASSSVANKVNLKKQSDRHPCFDCGLAGHWAGDPECQKPGQQLGRKKGKAVQKQVKVTEALNTEHTDEADPEHEVLVLRHQPQVLTDAFVSTVQNFHEPKEVNALGLALDKRLVGALDSACNRTCTGMDWLNSFLQRLRSTAPEEVIALVKCEPEKETFRFGNGGTQVSKERWRLPTMVGGAIICFWTSVVPVASLGLLLGRDFLEAVGAVMSFSRKALRCDHLDGKEIPLSQLTAGHYALHLLPSSWPGLGSQKPYLRYLPLPYPSSGTPDLWLRQGQQQVADGHASKRHLDMAYTMDRFVYKNLVECMHWRDRLGMMTAFCEDPVLTGMIHAKAAKGLRKKVRDAALEEAKKEALQAEQVLKEKPTPAPSKAKSKAKPAATKPQGWTVGYSAGLVAEPSPGMVSYQHLIDMRNRFQTTLDHMALEIQELRQQRQQGTQVDLSSLAKTVSSSSGSGGEMEVTPELLQDAAWSLEGAFEQQLAAHYGEENVMFLTPEERAQAEFFKEMEAHMNDETFFQVFDLMPTFHESLVNEKTNGSDPRPFLAEVYTTAQHVSKVARDRGHAVGPALSLETGWNFLLASHRERAKKQLAQDKPFCLVLAFPCGPFSPLQHLNTKGKLSWPRRLEEGRVLMRFALELADMQLKAGRRCIIENPKPSAAWREPEMRKFLEEKNVHMAVFDQCRFGLKSVEGIPQRKSTLVASSSSKVIDMLNGMVCKRDHAHSPVIGGSRVTARAGIYPMGLAKAMVRGVEVQFEQDFGHEALAAEVVEEEVDRPDGALGYGEDSDDDEMKISPEEAKMNIPASVKLAIKRLHENTGHRSGRRLARALAIAGAPPEAVVAAKRHRCAVCEEKAPPKARRPASLPRPKDIGDQVHVDLLEVEDCQEQKYYVCHCTDAATRFQVAEVLPNKSTAAVIEFLSKRWVAMFGPPRVLVCDQGREFISWEMEEWASSMSIMLHHIAVQAAPTPGSICYFYRPLRYNNKMSQSRKKLTLKRWHGPAMMVAMDGHASVFLSYKGQLTKCALEHVRLASTMEQIASGAWSEAIKEAVDAARHEQALRNTQSDGNQGWQAPQQPVLPETPVAAGNPSTPAFLPPSNATMNADENQLEGRDLPPVQPQELWQMMVPSNALASSQVDSSLPSRRASDFSDTPFPQATRLAMGRRPSGLPLTSVRERVREIEGSLKRPAELDAEALREQGHEQGTPRAEASSSTPAEVTEETLVTEAVDVIKAELKKENLHPLRRAFLQAELDKQSPLDAEVPDHGTWHGKWSLPSRSEWLAHQKLGLSWPNGSQPDHEVQAVQANRKEFQWRTMSSEEKKAFAEAAEQAWSVWEENAAIEVLTPEESEHAPTGSRVSQHLLFTFTASHSTPTTPREQKWRIMSADVKSAFLKGDAYVDGQRELFLENVKGEEPKLPFGSCLAKIRKGVFGLSDAPRQWYLRLNKSLQAAGWERTVFDFACWLKWSDDRKKLRGIIISHVDDLLLGGDSTAQESLLTIGKELGFGSVEYDDFVYCGKRIQMQPDGAISVSMKAYHDNLSPVEIPLSRRKTPEAELSESERRQLRAVLGSLQWLVAQVRFDQGYSLSTLQGEKPVIGTLQKANQLVKEFKRRPDFSLVFQALDLSKAGIMVVSDSSLGNVLREGGCEGDVLEKLYSQSAYFVIIGDHNLMNGREGCFNVVDARSHRLPRVCRSTYGAELMGVEEGMDMGIFCRGGLATFLGLPTGRRDSLKVMEEIPMVSITDAKDTYDRGNSDCPTYGAQKSMAFAVAWVRQTLNGYNSSLKWTATANMWVDAGTKAMPLDHMQEILAKGKWSYVYHQDYVKQSPKKKTPEKIGMTAELPGEPLDERSQMFQFVLKLSGQPGWHERPDMAVHVAYGAKSFRVPDGRFGANKYPVRSTFGKFDLEDGRSVWRQLEHGENLTELANRRKLLPRPAGCLISLFMSQAKKRLEQLRNHDRDMHG
ncbi:unnamed protein product [Durusdinium trenchii]|uniref:Integrase catalytic domain-containing protein n=1 Tax=Durusdinium trenchii TaxID=1381693 RepID=A0ABP0MX66_9DINO